jgi:hypothetical protein
MDESPAIRLDLRAPLLYAEAPGLEPFVYQAGEARELLFCFALDPGERGSIEPDRERLLGNLVFAGRATDPAPLTENAAGLVRLPAGIYLFAQKREALDREACIDLAVEQQKDGLWERLNPGERLYVRYLFEDKKPVTQLFRPIYQ